MSGIEGYAYNINWAITLAIKNKCSTDKIAEVNFGCLLSIYYYYLSIGNDIIIKWAIPLCKNYMNYKPSEEKYKELFWSVFNQYINDYNRVKILNPVITFDQFIERAMKYDSSNEL